MKYKITAKQGGDKHTAEVAGVKALSKNLSELRSKGYKIADISRVRAVVR